MKAENKSTDHNRTIRLTDISSLGFLPGGLTEMLITICYVREPNDGNIICKAVTLDNLVIPAIIDALNKADTK